MQHRCIGPLTTHPIRDGALFLLDWTPLRYFGAHCDFPLHRKKMLILCLFCFAVCGHHLSLRIAIVFSLLSSVPNFSMTHSPISLICRKAFRPLLVHFAFPRYISSTLMLCHKGASVNLLPRPTEYCYNYLFAGPGPLHEIAGPALLA